MQIAVASGKGGTGKTTVSVGLAQAYGKPVVYLDCDVEEPNGSIFLKPEIASSKTVNVKVPVVDTVKCRACGSCSSICQFNAVLTLGSRAMVFPELCHSCGGCERVCISGAITEVNHAVGSISCGFSGKIKTVSGLLEIGHAMAPPVIKAVKAYAADDGLTIVDCPPGTSCSLLAAVKGSDFVILVTEPTPFGLHDLKISVDTLRRLGLSFGVIVNRSDSGDNRVCSYCEKEQIPLLLEIPESREIAEAYSRGEGVVAVSESLKVRLADLAEQLVDQFGTRV